ncbi:MAG: family 43 glycosylhydrolase, partial [Clostridia bacterium]|nr:family 43 glycosylhydrolase [Clostridia bacterium]
MLGETRNWNYFSGCNEMQDAANHSYSNGVCICGKAEPHEHDFSGAWVQNEALHWKACECGQTQGEEPHYYENGICICGKPEPHDHDFSGAWVQGETQHWKECGCGEKQDEENHSYVNGVCKCGKEDPNAPIKYTFPESVNFGYDAAVHDPSVFKDPADNTYYVFGSHFAVASSTDLIHWTQRVSDGQFQKLYGNETYVKNGVTWPMALKSTLDRVNPSGGNDPINSTWAPDVEYHDGKYYMYYSLTKAFGSRESAIARVEADNVLGPYSNNVVLLDSINGSGTAPNCIDPELFYDKEGGLWMVYGSFFGGIYIKELYNSGENWGLPKESGFGKLLWKGGSSGVEGPYIFHSGSYYYLMVSDGSLLTNYNMRIARSTSPDGPYTDISGADMAAAYGKGNKLAGNWKFDGEQGKAAYGHTSVCELPGAGFVLAQRRYA